MKSFILQLRCSRNDKRIASFGIIALLFMLSHTAWSQRESEMQDYSVEKPSADTTRQKHVLQASFDFSSLIIRGFGGHNLQNLHAGLQIKHQRGVHGYRFLAEFYPKRGQGLLSPTGAIDQAVGVEDQSVVFLTVRVDAAMMRMGVGYEYGFYRKKGRAYFGLDIIGSAQRTRVQAYNMRRNLNDPMEFDSNFVSVANEEVLYTMGPGLSPLVGYEAHFGKHFGINLEAKADVNMMFGEGYFINDDATITRGSTNFFINTMPFLCARFHIRI